MMNPIQLFGSTTNSVRSNPWGIKRQKKFILVINELGIVPITIDETTILTLMIFCLDIGEHYNCATEMTTKLILNCGRGG